MIEMRTCYARRAYLCINCISCSHSGEDCPMGPSPRTVQAGSTSWMSSVFPQWQGRQTVCIRLTREAFEIHEESLCSLWAEFGSNGCDIAMAQHHPVGRLGHVIKRSAVSLHIKSYPDLNISWKQVEDARFGILEYNNRMITWCTHCRDHAGASSQAHTFIGNVRSAFKRTFSRPTYF